MFRFDEQVRAQPAAIEAVLSRMDARVDATRPVLFAGLGTSLHAARVAAAWRGRARAVDAHELALRGGFEEQLVVVSHGMGRWPREALRRARSVGVRTFAVCGEHAVASADHLVHTCPREPCETHSVSYTTALAALARLTGVDATEAPRLVRAALAAPLPAIAPASRVLVAGFALDAISAEETALKLKEACFVWAEGMSVERALHGPHHALREGMTAVLFRPDADDGGETAALRALCASRGVRILDLALPPCSDALRPFPAAVLGQRLAAEWARLTGGNPDTAEFRGHKP